MKRITLSIILILIFFGCKEQKKLKTDSNKAVQDIFYKEKYRPQYHFSPQEKWMNDPNGLVFNEGVYHLFYQYYPEDIVWGPMHWGHAISKDMVYWQHKPIALYPDELGLIFSGSAVVDKNNTSGFGNEGQTPLVAIYTYHLMEGEKAGRSDFQTQGIAYSLDNGDNWTKYDGNPVIGNKGIRDFRDPKVFWHKNSESWIMVLVAGDHAKFYRSKNLKEWVHISDFGKEKGAHGGVWECPDLFPLKVEGTDEEKWVLIISINPGAPNGGSGTQYFVGDFNGETFTTDQSESKWLDWGTDNYAGVTYNNLPDDERIFIGWMSNWTYARNTPTEKWRSAMTVPRNLSLIKNGNNYALKNYPLKSFNKLMVPEKKKDFTIDAGMTEYVNQKDNFDQTHVTFSTEAKDFAMNLENSLGENLSIGFDMENGQIIMNRTKSGKVDFQEDFGKNEFTMPLEDFESKRLDVTMLLDKSSIELFVNEGQFVMTCQIFPNEAYSKLKIENLSESEIRFREFAVEKVKFIW